MSKYPIKIIKLKKINHYNISNQIKKSTLFIDLGRIYYFVSQYMSCSTNTTHAQFYIQRYGYGCLEFWTSCENHSFKILSDWPKKQPIHFHTLLTKHWPKVGKVIKLRTSLHHVMQLKAQARLAEISVGKLFFLIYPPVSIN